MASLSILFKTMEGVPLDDAIEQAASYSAAIGAGQLECLAYLRANGCPEYPDGGYRETFLRT